MSSRKGIVIVRKILSRILIITRTNCVTKFITPCSSVVIQRSLRGVIKAVMSLHLGTRTSWSYLEKKSINEAIVHLANFLENLLTEGGRFISRKVTELSFIVALISRYI